MRGAFSIAKARTIFYHRKMEAYQGLRHLSFYIVILLYLTFTLEANARSSQSIFDRDRILKQFQSDLENKWASSPIKRRFFRVVIDAGHGGKDSGAKGVHGTEEKEIVLSIAKHLLRELNHTSFIRAFLTRKGDYFLSLRQRLQIARKNRADLFIAIHADAYFHARAKGASVYALSSRGASSEAARWLAKSDKSLLGKVALHHLHDRSLMLRSVLIDLSQTTTMRDSLEVGDQILAALRDMTDLHAEKVELAPFVVLKSPDIPSILVEVGFLSNREEEERLKKIIYQKKMAAALKKGILPFADTRLHLSLLRHALIVYNTQRLNFPL